MGEHADAASLAQPRRGDAPRTAIPRADEPDLEQELAAALGDAPVDQLLDLSASAAPAGELEAETRRVARVVSLHREDVFVDLGDRCQGVLPLKQFAEPPEPGATLEVVVRSFNREHGLYDVSIPGAAVDVGDWSGLIEGEVVEVLVTAQNKGGLECEVAGIRGFIPASQASLYRTDDLAALVGQRLACVVSEARREKRNLVLSRRAVLEREKAEQRKSLIATIAPGQVHEGVVRSLQDYGAFVDLGGLDGLIHVSQISWSRIRHPSEVLEPGQHVRVKVLKVNAETGKVSLGLKDLADNPWATAEVRYTSGDIVTGTVSKLAEFGAFVELEPAVEGLVHISELAHHRVFRVSDVLTVGQEVSVKVLSVDPAARRISLSIKATEARPERPRRPEPEPEVVEAQTARKKRAASLKGGVGGKSGGAQFGLKW